VNTPHDPADGAPVAGNLLARHPWLLVVLALTLFVGGSITALMIAIAHPPVLMR
jgi:hypothetical protein